MSAEYTPEQHAAVVRVMKLKVTDYYGILLVEKTCTSVEIKKAYRKLAVVVHPDKNKAPDADEAFKRVSKSFQVLSDEQKRKIFDQTGADPESRASYGPGPGAGDAFANAFGGSPFGGGAQRFQRSPFAGDDIFNMFFGGAPGGAQPQFQFQFGGPGGAAFGGGGPDIFSTLFGDAFGAQAGGARRRRQQEREQASDSNHLWFNVLLIAALLLLSPLINWLMGDASSLPKFRFDPVSPYTQEFTTPKYHIPFYVNPREMSDLSSSKQRRLQREAENQFVSRTRAACSAEFMHRQERMQAATGWFSIDEKKYEEAKNMPLPHCDLLNAFGIQVRQ